MKTDAARLLNRIQIRKRCGRRRAEWFVGATLLTGALFIGACASIPQPLEGEFVSIQPDQSSSASLGSKVRWGGSLVHAHPQQDRTCLEILALELDRNLRPLPSDQGRGRFLACQQGLLDPAIFTPGREVTVAGELARFTEGSVGDFPYRFPQVDTDAVHLWPEQVFLSADRYSSFHHGFGPRYGFYGRGFHHRGFHHRPYYHWWYW